MPDISDNMSHSEIVASHFDSIGDYSYFADKVVPFNKELHEGVLGEIAIRAQGEFTLLDLGIGQGEIVEKVLQKHKKARAVGVDVSEEMLHKARRRLSRFGERIKLEQGDFGFADFGTGYDIVISTVAIHNSIHDEKMKLFKRVYESLTEKGLFINGDFIAGESPKDDKGYREQYLNFLKQGLRGEELEAWIRHAFHEDNPAKLSDQFKWLQEAGFRKSECTWKKMNIAVYVAYK